MTKQQFKILHIDDDKSLLTIVSKLLGTAGFVVTGLNNCSEINKINWHEYDLLLVDLTMPCLTGFDICKTARKLQYEGPILVLSSKGLRREERMELNESGACHMNKPFGPQHLINRVRELLSAEP